MNIHELIGMPSIFKGREQGDVSDITRQLHYEITGVISPKTGEYSTIASLYVTIKVDFDRLRKEFERSPPGALHFKI